MIHISGQEQVEGVLPVKQRRGGETRDRLLAAGQRLVASRDIDSLSVAEIAAAAECSVGAFYQRFRDKDAFFRALIARYLAEAAASHEAVFAGPADDRLIGALVAAIASRFQENAGLIRAAIRKRLEDGSVWEPIRLNGHATADRFIGWMNGWRAAPLTKAEVMRARFAFQMLYGTLNNAIVNEPGPFEISDPDLGAQLERAFRLVLLSGPGAPTID